MKKFVAILAIAFTVLAAQARDPYDMYPLQLSVFPELQLFDQDVHITGLKLNFIYGYNVAVSGFDFGLFSGCSDFEGIQANVVNYAESNATGVRISPINLSQNSEGIELGLINHASVGTQNLSLGLINVTKEAQGLQIGVINYTEQMYGIQIGVINIISQSKVSFLPIINAYF
jgi:hypothetical protein